MSLSKIKYIPGQSAFKITIGASFVVKQLQDYINYWGNEFDLKIDISFAPYNQVFQELLNPNSLLNQNKGINILFIRIQDWLREQKDKSAIEQNQFLHQTHLELIEAINKSKKYTITPLLIGIVPPSPSQSFSQEIFDSITEINTELEILLRSLPGIHLFDLNKIATLYDIEEVFDPKSDEIGHIPFTQEYYAALGTFLTRKVRAYMLPSYKVIAVDCDNTLWKGLCSNEEIQKISLDKNYGYLQQFLLEKYNEGFLIVLCDTNNETDVWEIFDHHLQMKLKREHIAAYRINHDPKDKNFASIAKELNLGLDNFIFLNSNNIETEQLSVSSPEILSLTLPEQPDNFFSFLNHIWEFDTFHATEEDKQRNKMYMAEKERKQEQENFTHIDEFLKSLNIQINFKKLAEVDIDRALQLTLRTNQFNLNGIRKTREEILDVMHDQNSIGWIVDVKDKFGDYGIVGLLLGREIKNIFFIDTFVLSCRALGKNVEDFMLNELLDYCSINELEIIKANFINTLRNHSFLEFIQRTDWETDHQNNTINLPVKKTTLIKNEE